MLEQRTTSLTGLLLPLAGRNLVLPNVAIAELIDYQVGERSQEAPDWYLGRITWRDRQLPFISFEAACGQPTVIGERARIVVLNALGGHSNIQFIALLVQGIPRSYKLDSQLSFVDVPLSPLERAAVQVAEHIAKVPDLLAVEQMLVDAGVV